MCLNMLAHGHAGGKAGQCARKRKATQLLIDEPQHLQIRCGAAQHEAVHACWPHSRQQPAPARHLGSHDGNGERPRVRCLPPPLPSSRRPNQYRSWVADHAELLDRQCAQAASSAALLAAHVPGLRGGLQALALPSCAAAVQACAVGSSAAAALTCAGMHSVLSGNGSNGAYGGAALCQELTELFAAPVNAAAAAKGRGAGAPDSPEAKNSTGARGFQLVCGGAGKWRAGTAPHSLDSTSHARPAAWQA